MPHWQFNGGVAGGVGVREEDFQSMDSLSFSLSLSRPLVKILLRCGNAEGLTLD